MLGNTLDLSLIRNSIELVGFCILFLLLDKPRFSWKKTILGHLLFLAVYIIASTIWILIDIYSFGKFVTLTIFVGAAILFPMMSSDSPAQTIYNLSLQIFVLIFQIELSVWLSVHFCEGSPYADIVFRLLYLVAAIIIYLRFFRQPYRAIADSLRGPWSGICLISVAGNLFVIYYWTRPVDVMMRSAREQFIFLCIWALLFITHLMMIRSLVFMRKQMQEKQERELAMVSNHLLGQQLSMLKDSVEEARRIRHDLRHHANLITAMLQDGKAEDALTYTQKLGTVALDGVGESYCENPLVNTILAYHMERARARGMTAACKAVVPEKIGIDEMALCSALSNLLENAIEHGGGASPKLSVSILQNKGQLCIRIENSFDGAIKQDENGGYRSTKPQGGGIGLQSVAAIVGKYRGAMNIFHTDITFTVDIALNL